MNSYPQSSWQIVSSSTLVHPPSETGDDGQRESHATATQSLARLLDCRQQSVFLTNPLTEEDQGAQASEEASPIKWHLAHTSWFFEAFVLREYLPDYQPYSKLYDYCFNSYYESLGKRLPKNHRGLLTRPSLADVRRYRQRIDENLQRLDQAEISLSPHAQALLELGLQHEQQHQELMLTDILALFAAQPSLPAYGPIDDVPTLTRLENSNGRCDGDWIEFSGGMHQVGHASGGFSFDNETPLHSVHLQPFRIGRSLVTNAMWLGFMEAGGYSNYRWWLSDGWEWLQKQKVKSPGYWQEGGQGWMQMTLSGLLPVDLQKPVCHISYFEADAFARWAKARLPTEFEWEVAAAGATGTPSRSENHEGSTRHCFGQVWQWTSSPYTPYPGFRPAPSAIGEYNGKFMCSQMVLRGSSIATPTGHSRTTYRNFFYPQQRWQFTGLRLAD